MLTIGKIAAQAQVSTDTIRYYVREGLIRPARKAGSGYRLYTHEAIRRLGFIKHAQQCGFSLAEILELLELRSHNRAGCDDAYRVAAEKKRQLECKIKALKVMSQALSRLMATCSRNRQSLDACPILAALETGVARRSRSAVRNTQENNRNAE